MRKRSDDKWYYSFLPFNVSGGSTSPLIPLFVTEGLRGTLADVGMVSALSSAASVPGSILWGNLSDTTKQRKLFVLLGFGGLGLALFMMGISTSIASYLFANFLLGLLSTAAAPIGTVLILEVYKREEWATRLADFSRVGGLGWVTGLALGSIWLIVMQDASSVTPMRALFILAGTLSTLSILLAMKWIPEPESKVERRSVDLHLLDFPLIVYEKARYMPNRILHVLSLSATNISINNFPLRLRKYYVVVFLIFAGALCFYVALPIYLKSYVGISSGEVFLIYVASSAASTLSYRYSGSLVGRRGGKSVQKNSILARILLFPTFFLVTLLPLNQLGLVMAFLFLHAMVGIAWAGLSVAGSALVSNLCYKEFRAEGMGMYNATQGLAAIAGSIIGGFSAQLMGYLVTFLLASGMLLAAFLLLSFIDVETSPDEKTPKGNDAPDNV